MAICVKICGLRDPASIDAAITAGADMIGFVFFPRSPRSLTFEEAASLAKTVPAAVQKVALVVNADDAFLTAMCAALNPDLIQVHGSETPQRVADIKALTAVPVMKAIAVSQPEDVQRAAAYEGIADHILFDAKPPQDDAKALPGGNGTSFDWQLMTAWHGRTPWMLSGGLTSANVGAAIAISGAPGVDTSSGVEDQPGQKSAAKIAAFVAAARAAA